MKNCRCAIRGFHDVDVHLQVMKEVCFSEVIAFPGKDPMPPVTRTTWKHYGGAMNYTANNKYYIEGQIFDCRECKHKITCLLDNKAMVSYQEAE